MYINRRIWWFRWIKKNKRVDLELNVTWRVVNNTFINKIVSKYLKPLTLKIYIYSSLFLFYLNFVSFVMDVKKKKLIILKSICCWIIFIWDASRFADINNIKALINKMCTNINTNQTFPSHWHDLYLEWKKTYRTVANTVWLWSRAMPWSS